VFSEYHDLIDRLRSSDPRFSEMFDRHDELDRKIRNMETHVEHGTHEEIETLKKEKLLLKDQVRAILRKAGAAKA